MPGASPTTPLATIGDDPDPTLSRGQGTVVTMLTPLYDRSVVGETSTAGVRRQLDGLRAFYALAVLLVLSVGVFLFALSTDTDRLFAWTIKPPLTAAFLGANYWAAFFLAALSARERVWANARLTYVVSVVFVTLTMIATLLHLDKFKFDNGNGWLWTIVYVGVPPLLLVLIVLQLRLPGGDPPRRQPLERWVLSVVRVQLAVAVAVGVSLFAAPSTADDLWPWPLTPLTSRVVAAWILALAAGFAATLYERDWRRIRVAVPTFFAIPVLQGIALARFTDTVDWSSWSLWIYVAYLATLLVLGGVGLLRLREPVASAEAPLATA
jgi:hypothetical protein